MKQVFLLCFLISGCLLCGQPKPSELKWVPLADDHQVDAGDFIGIRVSYDSPDIPQSELIHKVPTKSQEGQHQVYPGSNLLAGTPTVAEIRERLDEHLSRRPPLPVKISVYELENIRGLVLVNGMVNRPGTALILDSDVTVIDAIQQRGGISRLACGDSLKVQRVQADGTKTVIDLDFDSIVRGTAEDFILQDGDVIYIPERICI